MIPEYLDTLVLWLIPLAPLAAALVTAALGPKLLRERSHLPCWAGLALSAACSLVLLLVVVPRAIDADAYPVVAAGYQWIEVGGVEVGVTLRADTITAMMLAMVTSVSFLVALFAAGYMHGDRGYARFFASVSLFVFSMCMLVLAPNFLLLFVFWEGVGLCSYLLIGFWYQRPAAAAAATKAFVVNRIGDFGFLVAIFLIWTTFGSLDFAVVLDQPSEVLALAADQPGRITLICLLLFVGAMGKSAQFPLHVWLPDAMEGPTPVSALIHAATMVTAGVYLVARCLPLFIAETTAPLIVCGVGAVTSLMAALIALTQNDLKRVLAYSTVSQLGYMFMALGVGAVDERGETIAATAMFHLFTHAYFKALLFLAAGSVMHAMGDVIDMRRFGGLRRALPITHWTFLCGAAALAGVPLLSGFWSKDDILYILWQAAPRDPRYAAFYYTVFGVAAFSALLTAFYIFRAYFMTFWGEERFPEEAPRHPHDASPVMAWPLRILAVCAVFIGVLIGPTHWFADYLQRYLEREPALAPPEPALHWEMLLASSIIAAVGIGLAWLMYRRNPELAGRVAAASEPLYTLSFNKFYCDEIFYTLLVGPLRGAARLSDWFDRRWIDRAVDGLGMLPRRASRIPLWIHNGLVSSYALVMWTGVIVCILFALRLIP